MKQFVTSIWSQRALVLSLARREVKSQYVGSLLGFLWTFIQPAVMVTVFWFVFSVGFKARPVHDVPFVVWLASGMAPWFAFAAIVSSSAAAIIQHGHLIKKTVFPSEILPVVKVVASMVGHGAFLTLLLVLIVANRVPLSLFFLQALYYLVCLWVLALAIGYIVSALNVFIRDVGQIVGVLLQVGFWFTPIFWDINMMSARVQQLLKLNPVYYIIQGYRDCFILQVPVWDRLSYTLYFWLVTVTLLVIGTWVFNRLRPQFADVL